MAKSKLDPEDQGDPAAPETPDAGGEGGDTPEDQELLDFYQEHPEAAAKWTDDGGAVSATVSFAEGDEYEEGKEPAETEEAEGGVKPRVPPAPRRPSPVVPPTRPKKGKGKKR